MQWEENNTPPTGDNIENFECSEKSPRLYTLHSTLYTARFASKKAIFEILTYLDIENDNPFVWIVV